MVTGIDIGTLIVRTAEVRERHPRIAGTGITVRRIVGWYKLGLSPEEIADRIGHVSLAQIHAALAYYHANLEEMKPISLRKTLRLNDWSENAIRADIRATFAEVAAPAAFSNAGSKRRRSVR